MDETRREPFLLTPGPLTTTAATKAAMLRDWGSRDGEFIAMNARVRRRLLELVSGDGSHVCVPLQGSGTFIVEAMIGTLVPPAGKLLVLVNGAYGRPAWRRGRRRTSRWTRPPSTRGSAPIPPSPTWWWCTARPRRAC